MTHLRWVVPILCDAVTEAQNEGSVARLLHDLPNFKKRQKAREQMVKQTKQTLLTEWSGVHGWYCYWDGSFGTPADPVANYVFAPPLQTGSNGVITSNAHNVQLGEGADKVAAILQGLHQQLIAASSENGCQPIMCRWSSEGEYEYFPLLVALGPTVDLSAESLLIAIGAHEKLKCSIHILNVTPEMKGDVPLEDPDNDVRLFSGMTSQVFAALGREKTPLVFYCGSGELNPVPFFVVGEFSPGLVGGFVSALVHT